MDQVNLNGPRAVIGEAHRFNLKLRSYLDSRNYTVGVESSEFKMFTDVEYRAIRSDSIVRPTYPYN